MKHRVHAVAQWLGLSCLVFMGCTQLEDPATLVSRIELRIAAAGTAPRPTFEISPGPATRFQLPASLRGRSYEYALRALDRYGNVLAERGSDADPELVRAETATPSEGAAAPAAAPHGRSYVLPITLGVAGLGAVTAGEIGTVRTASNRGRRASGSAKPSMTVDRRTST